MNRSVIEVLKLQQLDTDFKNTVNYVNSNKEISANLNDTILLNIYAYYKQATIGPNTYQQPMMLYLKEYNKWKAWAQLGEMTSNEAKKKYVELINNITQKK